MNWQHWLKGLAAAAISGVGTALSAVAVGINLKKVGLMLAVNAAISVGLYLKQSPLPGDKQ